MSAELKRIFELSVDVVKLIKSRRKDKLFRNEFTNLTTAQVYMLHFIHEKGSASMSELAAYAGVKMPTMTDNVDKLVHEGIVKREHEGSDRRKVIVMMTPKGEKMMCDYMKRGMEAISRMFGKMGTTEKKKIIELLTYLKKSLEKV